MITFHSRQSDCVRRARKNENGDTVNFTSQIASSICVIALFVCAQCSHHIACDTPYATWKNHQYPSFGVCVCFGLCVCCELIHTIPNMKISLLILLAGITSTFGVAAQPDDLVNRWGTRASISASSSTLNGVKPLASWIWDSGVENPQNYYLLVRKTFNWKNYPKMPTLSFLPMPMPMCISMASCWNAAR